MSLVASRIFCGFSPNVFLGFRDVSHHVGSRSHVIFRITELSVLISALKRPRLSVQHMSIMSDKKSFAVIDVDEKKLVNGRLRKLICFALTLPLSAVALEANLSPYTLESPQQTPIDFPITSIFIARTITRWSRVIALIASSNLRNSICGNKTMIMSARHLSEVEISRIYIKRRFIIKWRKEYMHVIHRLTAGKVLSLKSSCAVIQFL